MNDLNRRDFLKFGAAMPLALHSLSAIAASQPKAVPKRIMFICNSLGFYKPYFFPKPQGDLSTSDYLKDLKTKTKMRVFVNVFHPGLAKRNHDSEKSFLTGASNPESLSFVNTISLDQILARHIGTETRYPFLPLSIYDRGWGCSWNDRGSAIPPMHDEVQVFNKLFGPEDLIARKRQVLNDKKVLACLGRDMRQMKNSGAKTDKLNVYKAVISEMETQLKHQDFWLNAKKPVVANSLSDDKEFEFSTKLKNMLELSKLAFQTDSTRVITFSMDWIYGAIKVPGTTGGWHTLSHHGNKAKTIQQLSRIEIDIVKHLNQFLFDLDQIKEGTGTLLDHTTVVIGSNFGDASNHTHNSLPTIVAGGGYRHQTHTVLNKPTPLCNLYLELLHKHNIDIGSFGSSKKDMELLTDG
jgi:hypothetical protein